MKNKLINRLLSVLFFTTLITLLNTGCSKKSETFESEGTTKVQFVLLGANEIEESIGNKASINSNESASTIQTGSVAFSETMNVVYTLVPEKANSTTTSKITSDKISSSNNLKAAATTTIKELTDGVKYRIMVYDDTDNFLTAQTYTYKQGSNPEMLLDAGKSYTFVVYSLNSSEIADVTNYQKLNTATLQQIDKDLMFAKIKTELVYGTNTLKVILKHKFSSISTKLTIDGSTVGSFLNIINPTFESTFKSANLNLEDENITYSVGNTINTPITLIGFSTGIREVTSNQALLISPETNDGTINIGTITIDDDTRSNFKINNIKIKPGVRYTLHLNFKTCTQDVSGPDNLNWRFPEVYNGTRPTGAIIFVDGKSYNRGDIITQSATAPAADYGYVFDITELDNSINMTLNNVKMASNEIQFEKGAFTTQNIRFKDGSLYQGANTEGGTIPAVYNMKGAPSTPIVKIIITKNGVVRMYGSKKNNGPLYELELFNGNQFATNFNWSNVAGTNNQIKITQVVDGRTILIGTGAGKKWVTCNP